jgi:hypothetical protein
VRHVGHLPRIQNVKRNYTAILCIEFHPSLLRSTDNVAVIQLLSQDGDRDLTPVNPTANEM